ncbi:carbohydrate sulfotransferase 15-like [Pomacea canaliculata]|uniref:carbohydrate sulfotransferase 15-like n=1 Tax=Pomacea canaliculata TaxID=400727 RepID=UPI000D72ED4B|nr:carbohydrate sulfotransferase 15-like [Pomacea canaliculata]
MSEGAAEWVSRGILFFPLLLKNIIETKLVSSSCHGGQTQFPAGRHQSTGCCCLLPSTSSSLRVLDLCFLLTLLLLFAHREELWRLCRHVLKTTDAQSRDPNLGLLVDLGPSTPPEAYDLFKLGPFHFLDNFRNPCWLTSDTGQLACLPFFFLAGFPKCGTTELYVKLHKHQHVAKLLTKEPHWLTRLRYQNESFDNYTWLIAKSLLRKTMRSSPSQHMNYNPYIVGDGSASTVWDNDRWYMLPDSSYYSEPYVTHADYVRHLLPAAKIIIILRNPTLRIYSDYNFFFTNGSLSEFHELAVKQMDILKSCFAQHTVRSCVYNQSLNSVFRIRLGLYHVFLEDWFQRFPRDQIHVLRLEDLAVNVTRELLTIYRFLGLENPSKTTLAAITQKERPRKKGVRSLAQGPMLRMTKAALDEFYRPFNVRLASLLSDIRYLWEN